MNKNTMLAMLLAGAGILTYLALGDRAQRMEDTVTTPVAALPEAVQPVPREPAPELATGAKQRRALMRAEYEKLAQARNDVRKQLGRLKTGIWKLRVPSGQARVIEKRMYQGHILLKNPPLLGAFSSVDEINRELEKVNTVLADLQNLEEETGTNRTLWQGQ